MKAYSKQTKNKAKANIVNHSQASTQLMTTPLMQRRLQEKESIIPVQCKENKTGLPDDLKSGMENLTGQSLDDVKVHYNSSKPANMEAHAYAQGNDIHLESGQEKHLPHELGHIVQQNEGRVKPTTSVNGMAVNDSPELELEASSMGNKALQMKKSHLSNAYPFPKQLSTRNHSRNNRTILKGSNNNQSGVLQKVQWQVGQTTAANALPPALQAGYNLAFANPTNKPARPAWVDARVRLNNPWHELTEKIRSMNTAKIAWNRIPLIGQNHIGDGITWRKNRATHDYANRLATYNNQVPITAAGRWGNAEWDSDWNNNLGDLPGTAGLGGYKEYYAEPTGTISVEGFWGRNRIVRDETGPNPGYWWASSDHYDSFTRVT